MRKKWIQPVPSNYTKELTVPAASKKKKIIIIKDLSQVRHFWFELLPSGRCFRAIKTQTKRFKNILYSKVMTALKTAGNSAFFRWMHCAVISCRMWKCAEFLLEFLYVFYIFVFYATFYIFIFIYFLTYLEAVAEVCIGFYLMLL